MILYISEKRREEYLDLVLRPNTGEGKRQSERKMSGTAFLAAYFHQSIYYLKYTLTVFTYVGLDPISETHLHCIL